MKMAALPSPTQVAGSHSSIYEAYYQLVDPTHQGTIGALDAAKFLKKSGLPDGLLSKIWDLSDPNGKGYLNKPGFFVALKLVSLAQSGRDISISHILLDIPPPKMADIPTVIHNNMINSVPTLSDWAVKLQERAKYDQLFDSLQPLNGVIPGNKVKGLLIDSKLPVDTLGKIWDLADMDRDGSLDRHEFLVAMHLVYKALEKYAIPNTLPPELLPPGKRKDPTPPTIAPPIIPVAPIIKPEPVKQPPVPPPVTQAPQVPWVVTAEERTRYDILFRQTDVDKDGFINGHEIRDVFLQSGVPQPVLAQIWGLCDMKQTGKLNCEQFALAMWLINQKLKGKDPPPALTPEMIPPGARTKAVESVENNNTTPYSNPELDMISKDIEELVREKSGLESEILQKEADIKIKTGEVKSLQGELDTLAATLKQLESQKGEAQKRLNDLKNQTVLVESELSDVKMELDAEQAQVDKLRQQAEEQETSLKAQEEELSNKKLELEGLKQEESRLEQQQEEFRLKLENLGQNLQDSQLQISQVKASISQLEEHQRQMSDMIALAETLESSGDFSSVPDTCLHLQPEFQDPSYTKLIFAEDSNKEPYSNGPTDSRGDSFVNNNAFANDPFSNSNTSHDPFAGSDSFVADFNSKPVDSFAPDPFASAFGSSISSGGKADPFDPFGDGSRNQRPKTPATTEEVAEKDPFGQDPFACLHAPTAASGPPARPESPSPALPPKKSKQPPPRPAPPRPMLPPTPSPTPPQNDPFTSSTGFADFSAFNSKSSRSVLVNCECSLTENDTHSQLILSFPKPAWANLLAQFSDTTGSSSSQSVPPTVPKLDFTEDPFRDYRYEDPFNIADPFDDVDEVPTPARPSNVPVKLDPFGMEVPVTVDKPSGKNTLSNGKLTPLFGKTSVNANGINEKNTPSPLPSEDQQLAWAAAESLRLEEERKIQADLEKADLELALALSKETHKSKEKKRSGTLSKFLSKS